MRALIEVAAEFRFSIGKTLPNSGRVLAEA